MPASTVSNTTPRGLFVARLFGYFVFLVAFLLPACRQVVSDSASKPETYNGYFCAWITIINTLNPEVWKSKMALAILSGWINPLMLLYVASLFSRMLWLFRRVMAALILVLIIFTWVYFWLAPMAPLIGHVLWVAGILLIFSGEFIRASKDSKNAAA